MKKIISIKKRINTFNQEINISGDKSLSIRWVFGVTGSWKI